MVALRYFLAASLLQVTTFVVAHGHDSHGEMGMEMGQKSNATMSISVDPNDPWYLPSYSGLQAHSGFIMAHIAFMVAAWFFLLPIGMSFHLANASSA
jgi:Domain of unknown function (DUF2427)